jgi:hypothetical protein
MPGMTLKLGKKGLSRVWMEEIEGEYVVSGFVNKDSRNWEKTEVSRRFGTLEEANGFIEWAWPKMVFLTMDEYFDPEQPVLYEIFTADGESGEEKPVSLSHSAWRSTLIARQALRNAGEGKRAVIRGSDGSVRIIDG